MPDPRDDSPDATLVRTIHAGYRPPNFVDRYPGHLHIDLLPCLQGRRVGAQLMSRFFDLLREHRCSAVHLVVNKANVRAVAFYQKAGCHLIEDWPNHAAFGFTLT